MSHTITKANTNSAIAFRLKQDDKQVALSGLTVKVFGKTDLYAAWIIEGTTGISQEPTYAFTANATTDRLTHVGNRVQNGDELLLTNSGGALPAGLPATPVFAVQVNGNTFGVATVPDGAPIDLTDAGTGTQSYTIKGLVLYDFQTADVAAVGTFRLYFNVYNGAEYDTFPTCGDGTHNPGFIIYIVEPA